MKFTKMHGAGNDYIYVDCFAQPAPRNVGQLARAMSDRHFGVGGDGLILICPVEGADAEMRMFNADGSYSAKCAATASAASPSMSTTTASRGATCCGSPRAAGMYELELTLAGGKVERVRVDMGEPILRRGRDSDDAARRSADWRRR